MRLGVVLADNTNSYPMFKPRNPEDWAAGALDAATGKNVARRARKEEPLAYIVKLQVDVTKLLEGQFGSWGSFDELTDEMVLISQRQWERRIAKSLNSMSAELGVALAKPRCRSEQSEIISKGFYTNCQTPN